MRQKQHETQKVRKEGTGRWFMEGNVFIEWQDNPGLLWIQGASLPSSRSSLTTSSFEDLGKSSAVAFFYFDFKVKDENAVEIALRRIVLQLSAQSPHSYRTLDKQYQLSRGQALPNYQVLLRLLKELLREVGRTYVIFDALDECPDTEFGRLMDLISELRGWTSSPLHLMITSQPRTGFTEEMGDVPCVFLESDVTQPDIELFIASELRENHRMKTSRADEITHRVVDKSRGIFVSPCRLPPPGTFSLTLENLPNDLFGIYGRFLEPIRPQDLVYVTGVLRWLIFSAQNLTLAEIADAVAFDFSDPTRYAYDPSKREDNANAIPEWLEGLTTDYLLSGNFADKFGFNISQGPSHTFIARTCMDHLLYFSDHPLDSETLPKYPLARYAAKWWCHHLRRSLDQDQSILASDAMLLLEDGSAQYSALNHLRSLSYTSNSDSNNLCSRSPLHLCSEEGYIEGVRRLLQKGVDINIQDEEGSALQVASGHGHTEIVRLLLGNAAEVNAKSGKRGTALQVACAEDHTDIVRLLLASGTDRTLEVASSKGHIEIVRILLENGADVNAQKHGYGSALEAASKNGHTEIVRLLLENGADVRGALEAASGQGHLDTIRLLLENGADVNANGRYSGTALHSASSSGHMEIVRLLLENGGDVNADAEFRGSPLHLACENGHMRTIQLLLENGANANTKSWHSTPFQAAARSGNADIFRLLLQNGADVNAKGDPDIIRLLLNHGADVNVRGGDHETALQAALYFGRKSSKETVDLFLANGADANAQGGKYGGALPLACKNGALDIVQLLLANGADVNTQGGKYGNPLVAACQSGNEETIQILLANGADVNVEVGDIFYGNALHTALKYSHTGVARLLLENGAEVSARGGYCGNALQAACQTGEQDLVSSLLAAGADVNAEGGESGSPLRAASHRSHTEIVRLLVQNGADVNAQGGRKGNALYDASLPRRFTEGTARMLVCLFDRKSQGIVSEVSHPIRSAAHADFGILKEHMGFPPPHEFEMAISGVRFHARDLAIRDWVTIPNAKQGCPSPRRATGLAGPLEESGPTRGPGNALRPRQRASESYNVQLVRQYNGFRLYLYEKPRKYEEIEKGLCEFAGEFSSVEAFIEEADWNEVEQVKSTGDIVGISGSSLEWRHETGLPPQICHISKTPIDEQHARVPSRRRGAIGTFMYHPPNGTPNIGSTNPAIPSATSGHTSSTCTSLNRGPEDSQEFVRLQYGCDLAGLVPAMYVPLHVYRGDTVTTGGAGTYYLWCNEFRQNVIPSLPWTGDMQRFDENYASLEHFVRMADCNRLDAVQYKDLVPFN
ncbi:ankyrin repeat-containing domain protein [Mycena rebaudengoi]|nr:ankyrin repeat-containing domain protein [Mycena rebaudengoi]